MDSFPLPREKEVKFVGNVTTNGFSWPEDVVGPADQADNETGVWLELTLLYLTTLHQYVSVGTHIVVPDHLASVCVGCT